MASARCPGSAPHLPRWCTAAATGLAAAQNQAHRQMPPARPARIMFARLQGCETRQTDGTGLQCGLLAAATDSVYFLGVLVVLALACASATRARSHCDAAEPRCSPAILHSSCSLAASAPAASALPAAQVPAEFALSCRALWHAVAIRCACMGAAPVATAGRRQPLRLPLASVHVRDCACCCLNANGAGVGPWQ